jgi:nucleotide-binding universal stress UspA family protein
MNTRKNSQPIVLACIDQSAYANHVADYAAWAATRLNTSLELLHVIDRNPTLGPEQDHSGSIGANEQENLLKKIVDQDEQRSRHARETGRVFLNALRERVMAGGLTTVDMRQRHGSLVDSLLEREADTRLVVMGRRGQSSGTTQRDLGRNVETVVRALNRPILTVTDAFAAPTHLMIAFDGGAASKRALEMVATSPAFKGIRCTIIMIQKTETRDAPRQLEHALTKLRAAGLSAESHLLFGEIETLIARSIQALGIDLLVMGAYTHSPLRTLFRGSHTSGLLRAARVPTLLLR